jgi:hypothetical protein
MKHPRPTGTFGNMRKESVHNLLASCLNDAFRHQAVIDVSSYPGLDLLSLMGLICVASRGRRDGRHWQACCARRSMAFS